MQSHDCCVVIACNTKILVTFDKTNIMLSLINDIVQRGHLAPRLGQEIPGANFPQNSNSLSPLYEIRILK